MKPVCPKDKYNLILFPSTKSYLCSVCLTEYSQKQVEDNFGQHNAYLDEMETILLKAVLQGENPVQLITNLLTRHLLSDDHDPAHLNGIEFGKLFEKLMGTQK